MAGRLAGIARHDRPKGPMETLASVTVSQSEGVRGDYRGAQASQKVHRRRQVSLIERECWSAAMGELHGDNPWWQSRRNLLVEGIRLPRAEGTRVRIGDTCVLELTCECDPCSRMEAIRPGLKAVLTPDWRGGFLGRVVEDGEIAVGDPIRIEA